MKSISFALVVISGLAVSLTTAIAAIHGIHQWSCCVEFKHALWMAVKMWLLWGGMSFTIFMMSIVTFFLAKD